MIKNHRSDREREGEKIVCQYVRACEKHKEYLSNARRVTRGVRENRTEQLRQNKSHTEQNTYITRSLKTINTHTHETNIALRVCVRERSFLIVALVSIRRYGRTDFLISLKTKTSFRYKSRTHFRSRVCV